MLIQKEDLDRDCYLKIISVYGSLKSAEKGIADLILEEPQYMAQTTIAEAAIRVGCGEATFVRFAKRLGYDGFPQLKKNILNKELRYPIYDANHMLLENDTSEQILRYVFNYTIQALHDTLSILEKNAHIEKAVDLIHHTKNLMFLGVGNAYSVAMSAKHNFMKIGFHVHAPADIDSQYIIAGHMKKGDVIVVLSHTGQSANIIKLLKFVKNKGIKTIAITNYPFSQIGKNADLVINTAVFVKQMLGEVVAKRVAQMCVVEVLYLSTINREREKYLPYLDTTYQSLFANKIRTGGHRKQ